MFMHVVIKLGKLNKSRCEQVTHVPKHDNQNPLRLHVSEGEFVLSGDLYVLLCIAMTQTLLTMQ